MDDHGGKKMSLFKSSEKKDMQRRVLIKQSIRNLEKYISKLSVQYDKYLEIAKTAKMKGIQSQLKLAIYGIKNVLAQKKKAEEMLLNIQLVSQSNDLIKITKTFLTSMNTISKDMIKTTKDMDFESITKNFQTAMDNAEIATDKLDDLLETSSDSFDSISQHSSNMDDDEILKMLDLEIAHQDSVNSSDIDKKLDEITKNL